MNTIENNKLIAEFMDSGYTAFENSNIPLSNELIRVPNHGIRRVDGVSSSLTGILEYDISWDWLMPVVEKIEGLGFHTSIRVNKYTNDTTVCTIEDKKEATIGGGLSQILVTEGFKKQTKIEAVYNACIEFIKWYNTQKH